MQAMEFKRFSVNRFGIAAVALGVVALGVVGAIAIGQLSSDGRPAAAVVARGIEQTGQADMMSFVEQNLYLPNGTTADYRQPSVEQMRLIEQNTQLPGAVAARTVPAETTRFLEDNLYLPGPVGASPLTYDAIRFREDNLWLPNGNDNLLPHRSDSLPAGVVENY
jgi:hypothetical protein